MRDAEVNKTPVPDRAKFVGAPMPYFLRFTGGYGMHAGFVPALPRVARLHPHAGKMAKHFFEAAKVGTRVEVIQSPIRVER